GQGGVGRVTHPEDGGAQRRPGRDRGQVELHEHLRGRADRERRIGAVVVVPGPAVQVRVERIAGAASVDVDAGRGDDPLHGDTDVLVTRRVAAVAVAAA